MLPQEGETIPLLENAFTSLSSVPGRAASTHRLSHKVTEIELHPTNMNQDGGLSLCRSWDPPIQCLQESKQKMVFKNGTGSPSWGSSTLPASIWIRCSQLPQPRKKSHICNVTHHFHISHCSWGMKRAICYHSCLTSKYQFLQTWYKIYYLLPFCGSHWQQPLQHSYIIEPLPLKRLHQLITSQNFIT